MPIRLYLQRKQRCKLQGFLSAYFWNNPKDASVFSANVYIDKEKQEGSAFEVPYEQCKEHTLCVDLTFAKGDSFVFIDEDTDEKIFSKNEK